MTVGALVYFVLRAMHFSPEGREAVLLFSRILMPSLIFSMLTLTFLKVDVRDLRFRSWHVWGLLLQCSLWSLSILAILWLQRSGWLSPEWMHHMQYFIISFALCMITPTATAAAVVTLKLGGNPATLTLYTIFIDLLASLFRYARNTSIIAEAKNDKEQIQVSATLNADKSIHQLMVRRDDETITYTFNY